MRFDAHVLGVAGICGAMLASTSAFATPQPCPDALRAAGAFNVFVLEDFDTPADVEGKTAAGGSVNLDGFSIGEQDPGANALVVGNDMILSNGQVYGDGWYTGTFASSSVSFVGGAPMWGSPIDFGAAEVTLKDASTALQGLPSTATAAASKPSRSTARAFSASATAIPSAPCPCTRWSNAPLSRAGTAAAWTDPKPANW